LKNAYGARLSLIRTQGMIIILKQGDANIREMQILSSMVAFNYRYEKVIKYIGLEVYKCLFQNHFIYHNFKLHVNG